MRPDAAPTRPHEEGGDVIASRRLGSFEDALAQTHDRYGLVAVVVLRLRRGPEPQALQGALDESQARHPLLRARIVSRGRRRAFEVLHPAPPIPLETADWQDDDATRRQAQRLLNAPFDPTRAPLVRAVYLTSADRSDLLVAFHHAVMDAASAARLCRNLLERSQSRDDEGAVVPRVLPSSSDGHLPPRTGGLRDLPRLAGFVGREVMADWRYARETTPEQRPRLREESPTEITSVALDQEATDVFVRRSRREKATVPGAIAASLLLGVLRRRYPPDTPAARVVLFSSLRPYLQPRPPDDDLACHITLERLGVSLRELASPESAPALWEVARRISSSLYEAHQRGGAFHSARMARHVVRQEVRAESRRMGTAALSYLGPVSLSRQVGSTEVLGLRAFVTTNRISPEISALGHLFGGRLHLDAMVERADFSQEEAADILQEAAHRLVAP